MALASSPASCRAAMRWRTGKGTGRGMSQSPRSDNRNISENKIAIPLASAKRVVAIKRKTACRVTVPLLALRANGATG